MLRVGVSGGITRLISVLVLCSLTTAMIATSSAPAEARRHHRHHHARFSSGGGGGYNPPYAAMVVDANTGKTLYAENENDIRHPASLTKVMTLYLLFEAMEADRFHADTPMRISANAAAQAPSKLGLQPGDVIDTEDAIKAIVTKSANDIAVAIAENVGGSEDRFVEMMNRKARQLGMSKTHYANPSGLPDPEQLTSARDLITLGRAIQEHFPREYRYFSTRSFEMDGRVIRGHNHLLGRMEGVDGIKTGYTRASGFNLLTSIRQDGRHLIGVVIGGRSVVSRDQQMVALLDQNLDRAYAGRATNTVVARADTTDDDATDDDRKPEPVAKAPVPQPVAVPQPIERPKPAVVAEITRPKPLPEQRVASAEPTSIRPQSGSTAIRSSNQPIVASVTPSAPGMRWVTGPRGQIPPNRLAQADNRMVPPGAIPYTNSIAQQPVEASETQPLPAPVEEKAMVAEVKPNPLAPETAKAETEAVKTEIAKAEPLKATAGKLETTASIAKKPAYTGWIIQLAATDNQGKAQDVLDSAKAKLRNQLASAEPFTEKVIKGDTTLYRARFGGFDGDGEAQAACKAAKRAGFNCIAQKI